MVAMSSVVYGEKTLLPAQSPVEIHMRVWLYLIVFDVFGAYFPNKKKTKFEPSHIFNTNLKVFLLM